MFRNVMAHGRLGLGLRKRVRGAIAPAVRESDAEAHARDQVRVIRENHRLGVLQIRQEI